MGACWFKKGQSSESYSISPTQTETIRRAKRARDSRENNPIDRTDGWCELRWAFC